ncbi:peptidylprolyl isomerase [Hydrogenovibrio sp. 3SP14C1]|uniref:peptidylprolyl isomerase n=1 Tax=Hydrogenovibrio sp. 3SP14C1 TaxID=3038774 RepID=UPI0024179FC4|nr:peptidylprolyl isomerase [Hydrogenovibrio sp. 3SP14C1]MDG4812213.1 peptidylprolyl isomerase [Hydrogenovibrio sp. 3SP14C1]
MKNLTPSNVFKLISLLFILTPFFAWSAPQEKLLDRVVAVVNDNIILKSELDKEVSLAKQDLQARNIPVTNPDELASKVLDKIILERLQLQRINQLGIKIADDELFTQIQEIAKQNNLTVIELRDRLNMSQQNGFENFRERIRQQMLFQKLREVEVLSKTQVTEDEVSNFIQRQALVQSDTEYRLGHIMVSLPESATPAQRDASRQKAEEILQKIRSGEDFSQMAVRYSEGSKALQGGDLGWLGTDQIPTFFSDAVNQLEQGQTSDIIRSPVGFHIIQLQGKRNKNSQIVKQYHLYRFILLSEDAQKKQQPSSTLVQLAQSLTSLESFKQLNEKYSDIPASVNANGNLGWQTEKEMQPEYFQAIANIQPGHAAKPFATEKGWVILFLDGIRNQDLSLKDKRKQAMQTLRMKKANETYEIWLRRLKDEALIDIRLDDPEIMKKQLSHEESLSN